LSRTAPRDTSGDSQTSCWSGPLCVRDLVRCQMSSLEDLRFP